MPNGALRSGTTEGTSPDLAGDQLEALQHFIELGRLSASLLHEISSPLTAALLYLEQVDVHDSANLRQVRRSLGVLRKYVEAARRQLRQHSQQLSSFCIYPQIDQVKYLVMPLARAEGVALVFEDIPHYQLYGDPVKFQQVMANLIINAIDAYSSKAYGLDKSVRVSVSGNTRSILITVVDRGEGIPPDQLPRVFEPFYTTKSATKQGLGIGLTIVKEHVTRGFQGAISVNSSLRNGTQFTLKLPALPSPPSHFRKRR